jgi:hypothetical protein
MIAISIAFFVGLSLGAAAPQQESLSAASAAWQPNEYASHKSDSFLGQNGVQ